MFRDRSDAGEALGRELSRLDLEDPMVLGLPRGGVVVAAGVARALDAPLDLVVVRKLGAPGNPELGVGAVAEEGVTVLNDGLIRRLGISRSQLDRVAAAEHAELNRRVAAYRRGGPVRLEGHDAVVVDDGLATGYTARAAVEAARRRGAPRVILGVPVAAAETVRELTPLVDRLVAVETPRMMMGVGAWYRDFRQTGDDEVMEILGHARPDRLELEIDAGGVALPGTLIVPEGAAGLVVFAHGSGSSRHSPRNRAVAAHLQRSGLATLLFDLLTDEESSDRALVFDIPLLGRRLRAAHQQAGGLDAAAGLRVGYFGASTGAGAALVAAAGRDDVAAVVSRGGRPDLAGEALERVTIPVLLVVGGDDHAVLELNREAGIRLAGPADVEIVPGSGHLFEEPGALEHVAGSAAAWFLRWMA